MYNQGKHPFFVIFVFFVAKRIRRACSTATFRLKCARRTRNRNSNNERKDEMSKKKKASAIKTAADELLSQDLVRERKNEWSLVA